MRRAEPASIGKILIDFFRSSPVFGIKLAEARIINNWEKLVGNEIADYTEKISIHKGKMFIYVSSAVIRHEIFMRRTMLAEQVNQYVGLKVVDTIILK